MSAADSFLDEAEGFVQTTRAMVRGEDRQLRLGETPRAHPFQHALHHPAAEAALAPSVLDRDSDAADMAVLWEGPGVTIRRSDDLLVRDRDEEHVALAVEARKPPPLLLQVWHLFEHEVDLFSADAVRVAHRGLRVVHPAGPQQHGPPVPEGEGFLPHRVRHESHSGNLSKTSGRRRSPEARYASICSLTCGLMSSSSARNASSRSFDQSPFNSRYFRMRSIGSRRAQASTSSFGRYRVGSSLEECGPIR